MCSSMNNVTHFQQNTFSDYITHFACTQNGTALELFCWTNADSFIPEIIVH